MTESAGESFLEPKYARLSRIANIANLFAYIIFILYVFDVAINVIQFTNSCDCAANFLEFLGKNPINFVHSVFVWATILMQGVVYGLLLKGISLGLNMIVETALNYKRKFRGGENEQ